MPDNAPLSDAPAPALKVDKLLVSTGRRIDHQIARSAQGTFGAHDGLRQLVHVGTRQMIEAGASREEIRSEIGTRVPDKPPVGIDSEPAISKYLAEMKTIRGLMLGWTDECRSEPRR